MRIQELFEAKKMRAWSGKLKNIDALFHWMYEKGILTATDKKRKDKVFYQYYRYYNDGDMPAALKVKGFSKWSNKDSVETELEAYLESFIKEMLTKYMPRVNRAEFRIDNTLKQLYIVQDVAKRDDAYSLLNYWLQKVKIKDADGSLKAIVDDLKTAYDAAKTAFDKVDPASSNTVMSYRIERMKEAGKDVSKLEPKWAAVVEQTQKVHAFISDLITATKKLKTYNLTK